MGKYRDEGWLREQYVQERQSTTEIAEECGCAQSTVSRWLKKHDIETRTAWNPVTDQRLRDADWLREQYVEQRRNATEIAEECGCSQMTVLRRLSDHGIGTGRGERQIADRRLMDADWLRDQHVEQRLDVSKIADKCGCARSTVYSWLKEHDIETEQSNADHRLADAEWLREQYVEEGRSTDEIADQCGCTPPTVSYWLKKHNIETRPRGNPVTDKRLRDGEWLREQYVEEARSAGEIAEECACSPSTVLRWLNEHDIETGQSIADKRLRDGEWLREQYVERGRSTNEIAEECGCSPSTVSTWLSKHDIETRSASGPMSDARLTDAEWLREQYVEKHRCTTEIAEICGCAQQTVSGWLNTHDIETRTGGGVLSGEDHPSYKGGPAPYGPGWNRRKRAEVRDRDDHTCQDPNCSVTQADHLAEYGEKLHVHHLRKARDVADPEERNAKENLITLCRDCHSRWEKIAETGLVPEVV